MKKITFFSLTLLFMVSCSQPSENKVKTLIRENIRKSLSHPGSYVATGTVVDSAFAPFDDPVFREKTLEICRMTVENMEYVRMVQEAGRDIHPKEFALMTDSEKAQYGHYKEITNLYEEKVDSLSARIKEKGMYLMEMVGSGYRFIGWKVYHQFSERDETGFAVRRRKVFIIDKDKTKILAEYDITSKEYIMVQSMYQMWTDESMKTLEK